MVEDSYCPFLLLLVPVSAPFARFCSTYGVYMGIWSRNNGE